MVELTEPGTATFAARGPSRYHGGDESLAAQVLEGVTRVLADRLPATGPPGIGVADRSLAATLAALSGRAHVVPAGERRRSWPRSQSACWPIWGWSSVRWPTSPPPGSAHAGQLVVLPAADCWCRLGTPGALAHRATATLDDRPPGPRSPPPELTVQQAFKPPVMQSGPVVFFAKHLADDLHAATTSRGMVITTCLVRVESEHAERHERIWHHAGFAGATLTERVRWQLEGWAQSPTGPTAGITTLTLTPVEVVADEGRQLGFWGGDGCGPSGQPGPPPAWRVCWGLTRFGCRSGGEGGVRGNRSPRCRPRPSNCSSVRVARALRRSRAPGRAGCRLRPRLGSLPRWCRPAWWTSAATPSP